MASRLQDVILRGTAALRPVATAVAAGTLYFSTDTHVLERSTGSAWESYSAAAASGDVTGPGSALDQAIVVFDGATGKIVQDSGVLLTALATLPIAESDVTNLVTDLAAKAPLASPALTGTPTVPTASVGTNTTQAASTAFVLANAAAGSGDVVGPASATNNALALFDGTTGKLLKDSATTLASVAFDPAADHTVTGDWTFKQDVAIAGEAVIRFTNAADEQLGVIIYNSYGQGVNLLFRGGSESYSVALGFSVMLVATAAGEGTVNIQAGGGLFFSPSNFYTGPNPDAGLKRLAANILRVSANNSLDTAKGGGGISLGDLASVSAKPAASAAVRGTLWITWGTAGVADVVEVCAKDAADAYAWKPVASVASASTTFTGQFGPALYDAGNSGSAKTIDFNNGNDQYLTLTGNAAITFSNPVSGFRYALVINTGAGGFTPTFPGTVSWLDAVPTLPTTASKLYVVVLLYLGNVTKYLASFSKEP